MNNQLPTHSWPKLWQDERGVWHADCHTKYGPDLRGHWARSDGDTPEEALRNLKRVLLAGWDDVGVEESIQAAWDNAEVPA